MDLKEYRRIYSIRSVLNYAGRHNYMVCPLPQHIHSDNPTPSFSIYIDREGVERFKCHGNCGLQGDVIDLAGYLHVPGYDPKDGESVRRALSKLGSDFEISIAPRRRRVLLRGDAYKYYMPPGREVYEYAYTRGLTSTTVERFNLGLKGRFYSALKWMSIPTFEAGSLIGIKFRNLNHEDNLRFMMAEGSKSGLFNYDTVAFKQVPILIVKGEIPAMLLDQCGFYACAPTGGEGQHVDQYLGPLGLATKRIVVGDNDPDPDIRRNMNELAERRANALHAELRFPPEQYKDIDEWILKDESALGEIERWAR